ncbi:cation-transporting P-type ATPase [Niveibacterium umoris]|uniref:Magnesium-transporting ATPase (P-type) n=1 Tax=Niveibacterium umoris TaxID=1193620 RepID=A0A840BSQ2_9RHOO|nr:HAD-IC family P-type ATPase [Niveibacterium umoris]MBB4014702.1 magnesium-transporting ATPase (P-type) [Niveibacterium umoris]
MSRPWHASAADECLAAFEVDAARGLDENEVARRIARDGPNQISGKPPAGPFARFLTQLREPLIYILLAAGVLALALGEWVDAGVIFLVVLINAIVGAAQEVRAQAAIAALARQVAALTSVVRNGERTRVASSALVAGDIVLLDPGDRVPADLRLVRVRDLTVDESMLTGESLPVAKAADPVAVEAALGERLCMAYAGSHVLRGRARGVVVATGGRTEVGHIAALIDAAPLLATPLTRRLAVFSNLMLWIIVVLAALTFGVGLARGETVPDMLMAAVALAVGAIPEGLPAALTITLAIGVGRMARRAAVIRRLPAVEALGSVTVICSDKTGTLTQNRMTVTELLVGGFGYTVEGGGSPKSGRIRPGAGAPVANAALAPLLSAGILCNDAQMRVEGDDYVFSGDPTEWSLLLAATRGGLDVEGLRASHPRTDELPFDARYQYMATLNRNGDGQRLWLKGALERVLGCCDSALDANGDRVPIDSGAIHAAAEAMAARGMRVLAFACGPHPADRIERDAIGKGLVFLGLQGMVDPPRDEAMAAVARCKAAGIRVVMITGDHATTAAGIAGALGIGSEDSGVMTGRELAALDEAALDAAVGRVSVFARVEPEQKLRLVEALQARGEVVAMTGDGVNDAPALRQADIGVAMGQGGTDVAKESADMVLTDDNFASIEAAVEEGRGVYDNLLKFIVWTLPTNFAEGVVIMVAVLAGVALPITPLQILWINMSTVLLLGLPLAFEPIERDVMTRPPRAPSEPILTRALTARVVLAGSLLVVGAFGLFERELAAGHSVDYARTAAVNVFVFGEMAYLLNCRSLLHSWWSVGVFSNLSLWAGIAGMALLQLAFTYAPLMQAAFGSVAIDAASWGDILLIGALVNLIVGAEKLIRHPKRHRQR